MSRIAQAERAVFRRLIQVLLPATGAMPSGEEAGVADEGLDAVIAARGDLVPDLQRGLRLAASLDGPTAASRLAQSDAEAWGAIRLAALAAYYVAEPVGKALGYGGQQAEPVDLLPPQALDHLLEPVAARGPIWRQPPPDKGSAA